MDLWHDLADQYRGFSVEAADSPCFATWAAAVADDAEVLDWLARMPQIKRQPNLVFAAARWHGVPAPGPYAALQSALLDDDGSIAETILTRSTQTNEVGRLATLVPAFGRLSARHRHAALSLIEVGASAGLCLYPDAWSYRWSLPDREVRVGSGPTLTCRAKVDGPWPDRSPAVAARRGVDIHPLDVTDDDHMAWLEMLVWPEQDERRERLRAAIAVARADPPQIVSGDLVTHLPALVEQARADGPVVVFHSAVAAYLEPDHRDRFESVIRDLVAVGLCHWVSNEAKNVLPAVTATGPPVPEHHPTFVLGIDGQAVAWTHGHGRSLRWL